MDTFTLDFEKLIIKLIDIYDLHESQETSSDSTPDKVLIGIIKLISRVIKVKPELK